MYIVQYQTIKGSDYLEKNTMSFNDYEIMKNGALSAGWVEDVIEKHKLLRGKSCSDEDRVIRDFGVKYVYDLILFLICFLYVFLILLFHKSL